MARPKLAKPRGILYPRPAHDKFRLALYEPAPPLAPFVEHFWIVRWELPENEPYRQETLPHPCVHLVLEQGCSRVVGVKTGKFGQLLSGTGRVFGIKWRPGAFYPFVHAPVSRFTNRELAVSTVFGSHGERLDQQFVAVDDDRELTAAAEAFLLQMAPQPDENVSFISAIVEHIVAERQTTAVEAVARRFGVSTRTLQRLCNTYVGVGPKWIIRRYRLHDAVDLIAGGGVVDWRALALDLGYVDQAHFIRDFKAIVGDTPARYATKG